MANGAPSAGLDAADAAAPAPPPTAVPGPLRLQRTLTGHARAVAAVRLSPVDADLIASASADRTVRLWRIGEGREVTPSAGSSGGADCGGADCGGGSGGGAGEAGGSGKDGGGGGGGLQHGGGVNDVAWDPHGAVLASVSDDTAVRLWDAETGALLRTLAGHTNYAYACQFDPAGRMLATASFDETIRFWDVRTGRLLRETPAHSDPVTALSFSHDGTTLASGSFDGLVRLWDARNGHCLRSYASSAASAPVNDVALCHNGRYYLQATLDSRLRLIHAESGRCAKTYAGHTNEDYCCGATFVYGLPEGGGGGGGDAMDTSADADTGGRAAAPRGIAVASGSEDGSLCVWGLNSRKLLQRELGAAAGGAGHGAAALCIAAHASEPLVVTGGQEPDCAIKVWRA